MRSLCSSSPSQLPAHSAAIICACVALVARASSAGVFVDAAAATSSGIAAAAVAAGRNGDRFDDSEGLSPGTAAFDERDGGRSLQQQQQQGGGADGCGLCPVPGSRLRRDVVPPPLAAASPWGKPPPPASFFPDSDPARAAGWTCEEWDSRARSRAADESAAECLDVRDYLMRKCCDGLPPLYKCAREVREALGIWTPSGGAAEGGIPPISDGDSMDVNVFLDVESVDIVDYGVGGGAVEVSGSITLSWIDERLTWNASEYGCASLQVAESDIWVPVAEPDEAETDFISTRVTVMADGRVSWTRTGRSVARCETQENEAKACDIVYRDRFNGYGIRYVFEIGGNWNRSGLLAEEYTLNESLSGVSRTAGEDNGVIMWGDSDESSIFVVRLHFDPINKSCNICGYGSAMLLRNTTVMAHSFPVAWKDQYEDLVGGNCGEIDDFLTTLDVTHLTCIQGRAALEEHCCDDTASSFDCESSIHDAIVEELNTISPPDPSPLEEDSSIDSVDVRLLLDVLHIFDVDIKSNTMSLLVAVELNWYDDQLRWEPFVGGCHRVSYRASIDAELTEIWVPEIELINQVEGIQTLPEAHASVRYDGSVKWRRTGVLQASCAVTGVENFPFDRTGCYLDFGGTRDPLYHRIKYIKTDPEYSDRVMSHPGFQEYQMEVERTEVTYLREEMSGFSNEVIRYQFYFSRATQYYVSGFILLYILFTYLSFGMFFVDYSLGERLGYGSSILFVIVAQDITMYDQTPITDEMLWIYRLSFGSKIFVMFGIIQSLFVVYIFSHGDFNEEEDENRQMSEEVRPFLTEPVDNSQSAPKAKETTQDDAVNDGIDDASKDNGPRGTAQSIPEDDGKTGTIESAPAPPAQAAQGKYGSRDESKTNPRKHATTFCTTCFRFIHRHDLDIEDTDSMETKKIKKLRRVDWATALLCFFVYTLFIIVSVALVH